MAQVKSQSDSKQRRGRKLHGGGTKTEKEEKPPTMWFAFKRSLQCKSEPADVYDPKSKGQLSSILTKKAGGRSGCSRSIANLKDVIHGSKRHLDKPPSCSPRSIGSSEFLNPITHEVILSSNSRCELKITGYGGNHDSSFVGTLMPGTPGPAWQHGLAHNASFRGLRSTPPLSPNALCEREENGSGVSSLNHTSSRHRVSHDVQRGGGGGISCHRCGEQFGKWEALESHHLSKHAGSEKTKISD